MESCDVCDNFFVYRYTVGVAGQTVNLLPSGSGGSTPSRYTKFRAED
jgi:hypothetical protein